MSGRGRPLRFLALVGVGWVGMRVAILWPQTGSLPEAIRAVVPLAAAPAPRPASPHAAPHPALAPPAPGLPVAAAVPAEADEGVRPLRASDPVRVQFALLGLVQYGDPEFVEPIAPAETAQATPYAVAPPIARWSGSGWVVARAGRGIGAAPGAGQLGGSQAGLRIVHALAPAARLALAARITAPLGARGAEGAIGLEWQPVATVPVRLVAEQRVALDDGARGGPALGAIAGVDLRPAPGVRIEAYGQAGAVLRDRVDAYADAAVRATHALAAANGRVRMALGAGVWGAAQRDAARLDIGPSAVLALPAGDRDLRVALDWRQRVAGKARPGSGAALTLGTDF